jgi:hypothetical protein
MVAVSMLIDKQEFGNPNAVTCRNLTRASRDPEQEHALGVNFHHHLY